MLALMFLLFYIMSLLFLDSSFGFKVFFLTFQSLDLERVERKTPKKKLGEGKLLDDRNSITDNFDFDFYEFIFKRKTQWGWFPPSIMQKNLDQKWGIFFI